MVRCGMFQYLGIGNGAVGVAFIEPNVGPENEGSDRRGENAEAFLYVLFNDGDDVISICVTCTCT